METFIGKSIKIIYVDDDSDDREFFQDALAETKPLAQLITLEDGAKLMHYLAEQHGSPPDIIFLDINMPFKNGKECLVEIRGNPKLKEVAVIMFSTSTHHQDIEETFKNGANLYILKSIFINYQVKILKEIFTYDWKRALFNLDIKKFVLLNNQMKL